jgi:hypothetical protein
VNRIAAVFLVAPLVALGACSSSSSDARNTDQDGGDDGGVQPSAQDAGASAADGGSIAAAGAAGAAGVKDFCATICAHEQTCAASLDASPAGLADCADNCVSANESPSASPPTELLRADYLTAVGACIGKADCSQDLATAEATCAGDVVTGMGASLTPTQAVAALCHDLETTACIASDAGAADCVTNLLPYSDVALSAAVACFPASSCQALAACYAGAFTQM